MKFYTAIASSALIAAASLTVAISKVNAAECKPGNPDRREGCPRVTQVEGKKEDPTHRGGNRDDRQTKSLDDRGSDRNKEGEVANQ